MESLKQQMHNVSSALHNNLLNQSPTYIPMWTPYRVIFQGENHQVNSVVIEFQFDGIFINPIVTEYSFLSIVENKLSSRKTILTDGRNFERNDFCVILKYFDLTDWPLDARLCVCVDS